MKAKKDNRGNYNNIFIGYKCSQSLYIGFEADNKKLGSILACLSCCRATPEFSIKYELRDQKNIKEQLLKNAIADATYKAKVIVTAAQVNLGEIVRIDYDWSEIRFEREDFCIRESSCESPTSSAIDIEPDNIEATDTVSMVWEIK